MRGKLFFLLSFWLFFSFLIATPIKASRQTEVAETSSHLSERTLPSSAPSHPAKEILIWQLLQKIEILKYEVSLLQSLILNMQWQQGIIAQSYIAVNLSDNSVALEKNSNKPYPIASITKLMTAVIALENIELSQKITLREEMLKPWGHSPALYPGLKVSGENLLKASLIQSTNDAAEALTYFLAKEKFLELMNRKAKELAMTKTIFYDAHGLNPKNLSTASDLVKLLTYIYKNQPEILAITRDNDFWLPDKTDWLLKFQNVNNFYPLSNFIGGKTGYLPEAKQTLAAVFNIKGEPVAIVVLSSPNRQADTLTIIKQLRKTLLPISQ